MAEIIPFRGLRYNLDKIGSFDKVIAPPYDVISSRMQTDLYKNSDYNVVRLIHSQAEGEARYSEAAQNLNEWQEKSVLTQDSEPAIYVYEQSFDYHGQIMKRLGFIAALNIKAFGEGLIYPHERTMSRPREDRLKLIRATKANLSPIFALYSEGDEIRSVLKEAVKNKPEIEATDSMGVGQKLWLLTEKSKIEIIQKAMKGNELFIADGHHRYETSLLYKQEQGANGSHPASHTMMMFVDMDDEGLVIKPTHRVVKTDPLSIDDLIDKLRPRFDFEKHSSLQYLMAKLKENRHKVVFGLSDGNKLYFLTYKGEKEFDLKVLHNELKQDMGIKFSLVQDRIEFVADAKKAFEMCENGKVAFFVNPTPIETVKEMARAHQIMPQKSTYFYPKLADGLVIRVLN